MRLIDEDSAIEVVHKWLEDIFCISSTEVTVFKRLRRLPTVDAALVKHGRWVRLDIPVGEPDFKCTVCNIRVHVPTCMGEPMYEYCPVCGAKMDLEEDDDGKAD